MMEVICANQYSREMERDGSAPELLGSVLMVGLDGGSRGEFYPLHCRNCQLGSEEGGLCLPPLGYSHGQVKNETDRLLQFL